SAPVTLEVSTGTIAMPDVTGQAEAAATQALADLGLTNVATEEVESDQPAGTVLGSDPAPNNQVGAGTRITLQVSGGPAEPTTVPIPAVRGEDADVAEERLTGAGFRVEVEELLVPDSGVGPGEAAGTDPPEGSEQPPESVVTLFVNPAA
ncbi:MAG TPA: PASTA domain-containing protein, partial [Pedococcus sp.]|nr:PASTA domain-containing protein [Pedococcus sp.]